MLSAVLSNLQVQCTPLLLLFLFIYILTCLIFTIPWSAIFFDRVTEGGAVPYRE